MTVNPDARTFVDDIDRVWTFEPRPDTSDDIVLDESWNQNGYRLPPSDGESMAGQVVIDIGANIGAFTTRAAACGAAVIAYEPLPANAARFVKHRRLNASHGLTIDFFDRAVTGDGRGVTMVDVASGGSHIVRAGNGDIVAELPDEPVVESDTLADVIQFALDIHDAHTIAMLKVDVEGAEYEAFRSLPRGYLDRVERFAIEFHQWVPGTPPRYLEQPPGSFGALVEQLAITHGVEIVGRSNVGGMLYGVRY